MSRSNNPHNNSILHWNAQSLLPKLNELTLFAQTQKRLLISVQESWLKKDANIQLPDYVSYNFPHSSGFWVSSSHQELGPIPPSCIIVPRILFHVLPSTSLKYI